MPLPRVAWYHGKLRVETKIHRRPLVPPNPFLSRQGPLPIKGFVKGFLRGFLRGLWMGAAWGATGEISPLHRAHAAPKD